MDNIPGRNCLVMNIVEGVADEWFDIVDDDDQVIGRARRSDCHGNPGLIHRAVHVLVFDKSDRLLMQKRSLNKDIQPGRWDTSVGGHLEPGEGYLEAASREMGEELGLFGLPLTFLYNSKIRNAVESENVATFLTCCDGNPQANPREIDELRYWEAGEIEAALGCEIFTPNFEEEWAAFNRFQRRFSSETAGGLRFCAGDSFPEIFARLSGD